MKNILEFELDGKPVYVEVEEADGMRPVSRGEDEGFQKAETRFTEAIDRILGRISKSSVVVSGSSAATNSGTV